MTRWWSLACVTTLAASNFARADGVPVDLFAGGATACARLKSGGVRCWGMNQTAQLGTVPDPEVCSPPSLCFTRARDVAVLKDASDIALDRGLTCFVRDNAVQCLGAQRRGLFPSGTPGLQVCRTDGEVLDDCKLDPGDGSFACKGKGKQARKVPCLSRPAPVSGLTPAARAVVGSPQVCAVGHDTVHCTLPVAGHREFRAKEVALGGDHRVCTIEVDGTAVCSEDEGRVDRIPQVKQLTARGDHGCALLTDGSVKCWGRNSEGQAGIGHRSEDEAPFVPPTVVKELADVAQIAGDGSHTCALTRSGEVWCWGTNSAGELGVGDRDQRSSPTRVQNIADATRVAVGTSFSCALTRSGAVWCWGLDDAGQLGIGREDDDQCTFERGANPGQFPCSLTPQKVSGL